MHCRNDHQLAGHFYSVKVQTLPGALPIRYLGVHQPALLDDEQEMVIQRAMALVSQDRIMPETLQQRNPLYASLGWYGPADEYQSIEKVALTSMPSEGHL